MLQLSNTLNGAAFTMAALCLLDLIRPEYLFGGATAALILAVMALTLSAAEYASSHRSIR